MQVLLLDFFHQSRHDSSIPSNVIWYIYIEKKQPWTKETSNNKTKPWILMRLDLIYFCNERFLHHFQPGPTHKIEQQLQKH